MIGSKLLQYLKACSAREWTVLEKFAASPYYNENPDCLRLLQLLRPYHPDFDAAKITKRWAHDQLFPNQAYQDKALRYLMSDLCRLVEQFWVLERRKEREPDYLLELLEATSDRGLQKAFQQVDKKVAKVIDENRPRNAHFFHWRQRWGEIHDQHYQRQRRRQPDYSIQEASDALDRYYYLQKLRFVCSMLDRQAIFDADFRSGISEAWKNHLQQQDHFGEPLIRLYDLILQALIEEADPAYFNFLQEQLPSFTHRLPAEELQSIYLFAINYCARKIRQGQSEFAQHALELYVAGIENRILFDGSGKLSPWTFTNVVKLALSLKPFRWIEDFMDRYATALPDHFQANALHYNRAELYYYTHQFDRAQRELSQVAHSDLNYYLGGRVLLAKIYYESEETEALLSLIASFTIFLKRNRQLSADLKRTYLNFCEFLFQLVRRKPKRMATLEEDIRSTALLTDRKWLLTQYYQITT